jgi:Fic family protein
LPNSWPPVQRRQRTALARVEDIVSAACRVRLCSLQLDGELIESNKDNYYLALRRTQQTIRKEEEIWEPWIVFFLRTMVSRRTTWPQTVKDEQSLRASLPALSRQILELAKARGEITVKEIEDGTGANRNTIKAHLKKLAGEAYLAQVG